MVFTPRQARVRTGAAAWLTRHQAWLFFPLLLMEGINLHVAGVRALGRRRGTRVRAAEAALLAVHFGRLPDRHIRPAVRAAGAGVLRRPARVFCLYMGSSFAPNHKGMPILGQGEKLGYLRSQVLTSRNIRGSRLTDLVLVGLNYQIEHHLFPSMPRPSLRRAQNTVRAFCAEHHIPYCETSMLDSYAQVLRHLGSLTTPDPGDPPARSAAAGCPALGR